MGIYNQVKWVGVRPTVKLAQEPGKQVTINAVDTEILAANENRCSFLLIVRGTTNVFLKLGTAATVANVELKPDDNVFCDDYTGAVHGIVATGTGRVDVIEI